MHKSYYYNDIKIVQLYINVSGHQGRTQSDPHQLQVSVPLISRPVVSYRKGGTTPLQGVRWSILHLFVLDYRFT